ncbi:MAG: hypothetical protein ABJE47_09920 [bacterium]
MNTTRFAVLATLLTAAPVLAQQPVTRVASTQRADTTVVSDSTATPKKAPRVPRYEAPPIEIQHMRAPDQRGLNVFESPKEDNIPFSGFKLSWGGAFTQQFQNLTHENTAAPKVVAGVDGNKLIAIGPGFNNALANLFLNVQLARGIRVAVETYASARHHQESWVKDGYFLIDASPIENATLDKLMDYVTLKVGHFEVNFGDQHFRRSDGGQTIYNPFVGNYIIDDFTTEIGAEAYLRSNGYSAMFGMTGGEVHGQVTAPGQKGPTYLVKLGTDQQLTSDIRYRLTTSMYKTDRSASNTLTSGDRAGSRYYDVLENTASTETANAWSGAIQTGMRDYVTAFVVNPFVKVGGVEVFGNLETHTGAAINETQRRTIRQNVGEALYRFADNHLYVGGRYNVVNGELIVGASDVNVTRSQLGGGWFVTPNVLAKIEFVNQKYNNFPTTDIRNGGQFKGFVVEGAVAF